MRTITKTNEAELFEAILQLDPIDNISEHRRGSTFYIENIYTITEEDLEYFPELKELVGTSWQTNQFVSSEDDWGMDDVFELYEVEQIEKVVTTKEWVLK